MTIKTHHKLLLTGAAGGLGTALRDRLKANCDVLRLSDKADFGAARAGEEVMLTDLADGAAVNAMVQGVDAIVHLGGYSVEGPFEPILQANIIGVYHLYEAARQRLGAHFHGKHAGSLRRHDRGIGPALDERPAGQRRLADG